MIDVSKLRKGVTVVLKDGRRGIVRGCYMSTEGIVAMVRTNPASIVDDNVPIETILEVIE
jgi:hypothetical protein